MTSIPKIINKVYISHDMTIPDVIEPEALYNAHKSWKDLNPDYKICYWSGKDCEEYLLKTGGKEYLQTFKIIKPYSYKCDFFRYCVVYNEGGWYSDWKQFLYFPIDKIVNDHPDVTWVSCLDEASAYSRDFKCMGTAFFGAVPKHPILKVAIDNVIQNVKDRYYGNYCLDPTGPFVLGNAFISVCDKLDMNKTLLGKHIGNFYKIDDLEFIRQKCEGVYFGQDWDNGNNYAYLWSIRDIYNYSPF